MNKIPFKSKKKQNNPPKKNKIEKINISNKNIEQKASLSQEEIENKLIRFDLTIKFGPFKGITRRERFERAKRFNLGVDDKILDYINSDKKYLWAYFEYLQ